MFKVISFRTSLLRTLATTNTKPFKPAKRRVPRDKTAFWVEVIQAIKRHHKLTISPIIDSWIVWFISENYGTLNSIRRTVLLHKYISFSIRVMLSNIIFEIFLSYLSYVNYWSHERIIAYHQVLEDRKLHQCWSFCTRVQKNLQPFQPRVRFFSAALHVAHCLLK